MAQNKWSKEMEAYLAWRKEAMREADRIGAASVAESLRDWGKLEEDERRQAVNQTAAPDAAETQTERKDFDAWLNEAERQADRIDAASVTESLRDWDKLLEQERLEAVERARKAN